MGGWWEYLSGDASTRNNLIKNTIMAGGRSMISYSDNIVEDKPVLLDYWTSSLDKKALVGVKETGEKLLVKSEDEYTSPIAKFYKSSTEYIIITENSIYLVSADIPTRKIS